MWGTSHSEKPLKFWPALYESPPERPSRRAQAGGLVQMDQQVFSQATEVQNTVSQAWPSRKAA